MVDSLHRWNSIPVDLFSGGFSVPVLFLIPKVVFDAEAWNAIGIED